MEGNTLGKFLDAQKEVYKNALSEIKAGRKTSHWMWFIFPQIKGLGRTDIAIFYSIADIEEATAYLSHPILGHNLIEISKAVFNIENKTAREIFGKPDDRKLRSCMTLFSMVKNADPIFKRVIAKYFEGQEDINTIEILNQFFSNLRRKQ
jgi:uncharacterized protein (DUF1810 family)